MADIARGDIGEFLNGYGGIDLDEARKRGLTKLIKKIKQRTVTKIGKGDKDEDTEVNETEIELYPADAALERVLKITGKFREAPTFNVNMTWKEFVENANGNASDNEPA
jgi:hypothetical protein